MLKNECVLIVHFKDGWEAEYKAERIKKCLHANLFDCTMRVVGQVSSDRLHGIAPTEMVHKYLKVFLENI
jgi:hypothetical protein